MFIFVWVPVKSYLNVERAILGFLLQVEGIVEEFELHDRFGGEPATIDFLDTIYYTERVHAVGGFITAGYLPWVQMRFPATNVHIF